MRDHVYENAPRRDVQAEARLGYDHRDDAPRRKALPPPLIVPPTEALGLVAVPITDKTWMPCSQSSVPSSTQSATGASGNTCDVAEGDLHCCLEEVLALASSPSLAGTEAAQRIPELVADIRRDANDMREDRVTAEWLLKTKIDDAAAEADRQAASLLVESAGPGRTSPPNRQSALLLCAGLAVAVAGGSAVSQHRELVSVSRELRASRAECSRVRSQLAAMHAARGRGRPVATSGEEEGSAPLAAEGSDAAGTDAIEQAGPDHQGLPSEPSLAGHGAVADADVPNATGHGPAGISPAADFALGVGTWLPMWLGGGDGLQREGRGYRAPKSASPAPQSAQRSGDQLPPRPGGSALRPYEHALAVVVPLGRGGAHNVARRTVCGAPCIGRG